MYTTRDGGAAPRAHAGVRRGKKEGGGGGGSGEQTTGAEECETEYDQLRQGSFDFEWGSFLCAPVRSGARAVGEAATEGLDGHTHDYDRYERHGQPSEPFVARAARA